VNNPTPYLNLTEVEAAAKGRLTNLAYEYYVGGANDEVTVRHLPPGGAAFLGALLSGECLAAAVAAGLEAEPAFDLSGMIGEMIAAHAFSTIRAFSHVEMEIFNV